MKKVYSFVVGCFQPQFQKTWIVLILALSFPGVLTFGQEVEAKKQSVQKSTETMLFKTKEPLSESQRVNSAELLNQKMKVDLGKDAKFLKTSDIVNLEEDGAHAAIINGEQMNDENGFAKAEQSTTLPSSGKNIEINTDVPITNALPPRGVIFTGGNFDFQFPPLTSTATISAWGAGGAGGGVNNSNGAKAGGGGGGGAFAQSVITVGNGTIYSGVAGVGGSGNGSDSNWNSNAILAKGGTAGGVGNINADGTGGTGGLATASTGTIRYSGGNGASGSRSSSYSGGGGGSAGQGSVGGNASGLSGGTAGTGTPAGAAGANGRNDNGVGNNGTIPGSGGSGAYRVNGNNAPAGGKGAHGQVLINYEGYCRPLSASNATYINALSTTNGVVNISQTNTGYGAYGYQNFYYDPNGTVSAPAGGTFDLSFTLVTGGTGWNNTAGVAIWIDWNQDGVFDATERIVTSNQYLTSGTYNVVGGITVPPAQATGDYVMRIVTDYNATNPDSCNLSNSGPRGEGEDYKLTVQAAVSCDPITATADKYSVCSGDAVTLTASSTSTGYTYTWYTDWDNNTHTGTLVGTGASVVVNPTASELYGVVATKTGCPTGVNAAYALITIAVTPPPSLIVMDPVSSITCSNEVRQISVVSGGVIPKEILTETWNPLANPWIVSTSVSGGSGPTYAAWGLAADGYRGIRSPDQSNFAVVDSDAYGPYQMESSLISRPMSFTDYNTPITLEFDHYFRQYLSSSTAYVEITTDGINWTTLTTYTITQGLPTNFAPVTTNLNAYAGQPFVQIRFRYNAYYAYYWAVDNIKVTGTNPLPTTVTWKVKNSSPASYAGLYTDAAGTIPYTGGHATTLYASPASTTTYTISAKTSVGCPAEEDVTVNRGDKDWISPSSTDWNIAANWNEGGVPTADQCVRIPNTANKPIINGTTQALAKNVIIDNGGGLTIENGGSLTVTDYIKNYNSNGDTFIVKQGANLVQVNDNASNTGQMTAEKEFVFTGAPPPNNNHLQYNFTISPVKNQNIKTVVGIVTDMAQSYNEGTNYFDESTGDYEVGKGFAVREPNGRPAGTATAKYKGEPFNGVANITLTKASDGYNLIGNPYPSTIDLRQIYQDNSANRLMQDFYFWDNRGNTLFIQQGSSYNGDHYAKFNAASGTNGTGSAAPLTPTSGPNAKIPDRFVTKGTAFIAQAKNAGSLILNNSIRRVNPGIDFAGKGNFNPEVVDDRYWLTITAPSGIQPMLAVVYFSGGQDGFWIDDTESSLASDDIYTLADNKKLVIQGKRSFRVDDQVPLGYKAFGTGTHIIQVYKTEGVFEEQQDIYLIDNQLNLVWNISEKPYKFMSRAGEFSQRFTIAYKPRAFAPEFSKNEIDILKKDKQIVISSSIDKMTEIEIFDINSRSVYKKSNINSNEHKLAANLFNHQVIVVTVKTETGEFVTKKFVNK